MGLMKGLSEFAEMGYAYRRGEYPPFLYSNGEDSGYLPCFYYHDISSDELEGHLQYVKDNGYRTIVCGEACESFLGSRPSHQREILLTFDDGLESLYRVVFPLIKRYAVKATAYIVPEWVGSPGFITWSQCREMMDSGCVDFQSHSLRHAANLFEKIDEGSLASMVNDLEESKRHISNNLPGHVVRHFAFPSHRNGSLAWRALERTGYLSGAVGIRSTYQGTEEGKSVIRLFRVNADFVFCLPGEKRQASWQVMMRKLGKRLGNRNVYGAAAR